MKIDFLKFFLNRQRFGLFSQPVSVAIGDTNKFITTKANRDEEGRVIIGPRNFYTKKEKKGKIDSVYFLKPSYNASGDPYRPMTASAGMRSLTKDGFLKAGHEMNFKPAKIVKEKLYQASYKYLPNP